MHVDMQLRAMSGSVGVAKLSVVWGHLLLLVYEVLSVIQCPLLKIYSSLWRNNRDFQKCLSETFRNVCFIVGITVHG